VSPQLAEATLARLGRTINQHLDQLAAIQRPVVTRTHSGSSTTWPTVTGLDAVPCSVAPGGLSPTEQAVAEGVKAVTPWMLTFPRGTDIRSTDRVVVGSRTFEVIAARRPRTYELQTRVTATEVK